MAIERIADRYDVNRRLGTGGMGDVWLAQDDLLGRQVAIKFVGERELRETPGAEAILQDEARNAGQLLGHPQVVSVIDLIDVETDLHRGPAVVLEYVEGCNLGEWIAIHRDHLDPFTQMQTGLYIVNEIVEALTAAHKLNILHRDVKPQNVLCSVSGRIKVADFGLSRVVEALTRSHTVWGRHTPLYSAPEQWNGEKPDTNTDVYQLAATAYHLLAGVPANSGDNIMALLRWHQSGKLVPLAQHVSSIDADVAHMIDLGLSKDPATRPSLWAIFDAVSAAIVKVPVKLTVDVDECSEDVIAQVAHLTDFSLQSLVKERKRDFMFPHPVEAIQEVVGATLLGARCSLVVPS